MESFLEWTCVSLKSSPHVFLRPGTLITHSKTWDSRILYRNFINKIHWLPLFHPTKRWILCVATAEHWWILQFQGQCAPSAIQAFSRQSFRNLRLQISHLSLLTGSNASCFLNPVYLRPRMTIIFVKLISTHRWICIKCWIKLIGLSQKIPLWSKAWCWSGKNVLKTVHFTLSQFWGGRGKMYSG